MGTLWRSCWTRTVLTDPSRQLAELDPEKRTALKARRSRIEVLLNDLAGRASAEGVAARGEVSAGDRLSNCCGLGGQRGKRDEPGGWHHRPSRIDPHIGGGAYHLVHGEHVADSIDHRNSCRRPTCLRFGDRLQQDLLDLAGRKGFRSRERIGGYVINAGKEQQTQRY